MPRVDEVPSILRTAVNVSVPRVLAGLCAWIGTLGAVLRKKPTQIAATSATAATDVAAIAMRLRLLRNWRRLSVFKKLSVTRRAVRYVLPETMLMWQILAGYFFELLRFRASFRSGFG